MTDPAVRTRLTAVRRRLLAWYGHARRPLPWRAPGADPYRAWLAEVMLQQTRVEAALPYWRRFVERFPTIEALAAAEQGDVLALWAGLGYYARALNLHRAAREAVARHGGLPASLEALRALPGFGPYISGAVASIAFGIRTPAVDGNAARVLSRLFLVAGPPEAPAVREGLWRIARALVPAERPGDLNQALMELGALVCRRSPRCERCPLRGCCAARRAGREQEIPLPRRRPAARAQLLACAAVERRGRLLLARRDPAGLLGGLWELPSAPVLPGRDPRAALRHALRARLGVAIQPGRLLASIDRALTHRRLRLAAYACPAPRGLRSGAGLRWAIPGDLGRLGVSTAMLRLAEAIAAGEPRPAPGRARPGAAGGSAGGGDRSGPRRRLGPRGSARQFPSRIGGDP